MTEDDGPNRTVEDKTSPIIILDNDNDETTVIIPVETEKRTMSGTYTKIRQLQGKRLLLHLGQHHRQHPAQPRHLKRYAATQARAHTLTRHHSAWTTLLNNAAR